MYVFELACSYIMQNCDYNIIRHLLAAHMTFSLQHFIQNICCSLVKQLLYWNSMKKSKKISEQAVTPERLSSNVVVAKDAYKRWQVAMAVDGFAKDKP